MKRLAASILGVLLLAALMASPGSASAPSKRQNDARRQLGSAGRVSFHDDTGTVRFIGTDAGRAISRPAAVGRGASAEATARAFLNEHGNLLGIANQARELRFVGSERGAQGREMARFQQVYRGVPVMAGELVVGLDQDGNILHANGETLPAPKVDVSPTVTADSAADTARRLVAGLESASPGELTVSDPELWVYDRELLGGPGPITPKLVWRTEVTGSTRPDIRELVLVDAEEDSVVLHFTQIMQAKNRKVCDAANANAKVPCNTPFARTEGQGSTGVADVNLAYDYSGGVYDFFKQRFNRDSIDNAGMPLIHTVRYCESGCPFDNAFWNGEQMVYGPGYASADDVVGHEMAHGVTEKTAGLFYWFQSGAINESLSDVFGELYDLTNGAGIDTALVRWKMGENLPGGAIRDMGNPGAFGDPDRMSSPNYESGTDGFGGIVDSGGVHTNSGVNNKAASLLVDGGIFNGRTVSPLGVDKVAKLYYDVVANVLTSGSDYADLYDALYQSCQNLVGTAGFTASNCAEVRDATDAVEMFRQPNDTDIFPNVEDAPVCPVGEVPTDLFYDNMERPAAGNWTLPASSIGTNRWVVTPGYAASGKWSLYTPDQEARSDTSVQMVPSVPIPAGTNTYLRFSQAVSFESFFDFSTFNYHNIDGGVLEYTTNGSTWIDAQSLFVNSGDNGYYGQLSTISDNPLEGRFGFVDTTGGYFSSRATLSSLAGSSVKFRFRAGTDQGTPPGFFGWVIDDVRIYTCDARSRPGPSPTNKLRNPGFEFDDNDDGFPDFWTMNQSALRMRDVNRNGSYSMGHSAADNEKYTTSQRVTGISGGQPYTFTGFVNIPNTSKTVNFTLQVQFRKASGAVVGTKKIKTYTASTGGSWNRARSVMTSPARAATAKVSMVQKGLGATVYVDDFQFKRQ